MFDVSDLSIMPRFPTAVRVRNYARVRIGIATGALDSHQGKEGIHLLASSDIAKLANSESGRGEHCLPGASDNSPRSSVLSEAGNGGQILLCESTFKAVQHMTEELGCVTHEGMDYKKLHSTLPWLMFMRGWDPVHHLYLFHSVTLSLSKHHHVHEQHIMSTHSGLRSKARTRRRRRGSWTWENTFIAKLPLRSRSSSHQMPSWGAEPPTRRPCSPARWIDIPIISL
jgi:hypothetical protein